MNWKEILELLLEFKDTSGQKVLLLFAILGLIYTENNAPWEPLVLLVVVGSLLITANIVTDSELHQKQS